MIKVFMEAHLAPIGGLRFCRSGLQAAIPGKQSRPEPVPTLKAKWIDPVPDQVRDDIYQVRDDIRKALARAVSRFRVYVN